jgi:hypothetical protein
VLPSGLVSSAFSSGASQWAQFAFTAILHLLQVYVAILNLQVVGSRRDEGNTTVSPILGEVCRWASVLLSKAAAA